MVHAARATVSAACEDDDLAVVPGETAGPGDSGRDALELDLGAAGGLLDLGDVAREVVNRLLAGAVADGRRRGDRAFAANHEDEGEGELSDRARLDHARLESKARAGAPRPCLSRGLTGSCHGFAVKAYGRGFRHRNALSRACDTRDRRPPRAVSTVGAAWYPGLIFTRLARLVMLMQSMPRLLFGSSLALAALSAGAHESVEAAVDPVIAADVVSDVATAAEAAVGAEVAVSADIAVESRRSYRFGVLFWHSSPNDEAALAGLRDGLRQRGWPHRLDVQRANEDEKKARAILDAFVRQKVDVVFSLGTKATLLAKERVKSIPVVFTAVTNPVESKILPSWRGSGSNLAGTSNWIESATVLRVFRLAVPRIARLGVLRSHAAGLVSSAEIRGLKRVLEREDSERGARTVLSEAYVDGDGTSLDKALRSLVAQRVEAIWIPIDRSVYEQMPKILAFAKKQRLPLLSSSLRGTRSGACAGIVVDYEQLARRAVVIALDILDRHEKPGSIPVGTMRGYQVVVNLEAAKLCAHELPLELLIVADSIHSTLAGSKAKRSGKGR